MYLAWCGECDEHHCDGMECPLSLPGPSDLDWDGPDGNWSDADGRL